MAAKFINVGYGNLVAKRLVQDARDAGVVIDVSCGKKTRSVIVTDSKHVILSSLEPETLGVVLNQDS